MGSGQNILGISELALEIHRVTLSNLGLFGLTSVEIVCSGLFTCSKMAEKTEP